MSPESATNLTGPQQMRAFKQTLQKHVIGYPDEVEMTVLAVYVGGNVVFIGHPGTGKTWTIKCASRYLYLPTQGIDEPFYRRVQMTPDLLPADLIGTEVLYTDKTTGRNEFVFVRGPIFTVVMHADEINRTLPRTQSALLEAMEEKQVSIAGVNARTVALNPAFILMATQNPYDRRGTYELPPAELDRFAIQLLYRRLSREKHLEVMRMTASNRHDMSAVPANVLNMEDVLATRPLIDQVHLDERAERYINDLIYALWPGEKGFPPSLNGVIESGPSPRAGQWIIRMSKARAFMRDSKFVSSDDIRFVLPHVLRHRLEVTDRKKKDWDTDLVVAEVVRHVQFE